MNISEWLRSADTALQGSLAPESLDPLRVAAERIADMTGWAPGVIDPQGRIDSELARLQDRAKTLYLEHNDQTVAALHDALGDLRQAIAQHDADFAAPEDDDDYVLD